MPILAYKTGTLIAVSATLKTNTWKESGTKETYFTVHPNEETRKVFDGPTAVNDALHWIGTPQALELVLTPEDLERIEKQTQ